MTARAPRRLAALFTAIVVTGVSMAVGLGVPPAGAKPPPKPGPVTGLQMTLTKPANDFLVEASWNASTNATTYDVVLSNAANGTQLAGNTVAITQWSASVDLTGVAQLRLTVTPRNQRPGTAVSITQDVPDLNAPMGTFEVSWVDLTGTITQTSLTDDGPVGNVTRTVDWGDATTPEAWPSGDTIDHLYAAEGLYRPTVTLTDGVGNSRVVQLDAIVPGDDTAPTGTFTTSPATAWKGLTAVSLTQTALDDDFSDPADVERSILWGDGGALQTWNATLSISHVYAPAGVYTPQVILRDEAGNQVTVDAPAVTVVADTVVPLVKIKVPRKAIRDEVSAWKKVDGKATDANGTGVDRVTVRAIEKRATGWYYYKPATKSWVKTTTKDQAWSRAKAKMVDPSSLGLWSVRLAGLRKGTLWVRATATDRAGNVSKQVTQKAVLTSP